MVERMECYEMIIKKGLRGHVWDERGNEYIDYSMGSAALLLGHSHEAIVEAVNLQVDKGTLFSSLTEKELEWAELISKMYPSLYGLPNSLGGEPKP